MIVYRSALIPRKFRWPKKFLVTLLDIDDIVDTIDTKFSINFAKANTKFSLSLHYNDDESCL